MENLFEEGFTQNRELSWLRFNDRIMEEACDSSVPLFERLNFLNIFSSNLFEFFQVRVGSLLGNSDDEEEIDPRSGLRNIDQLKAISDMVKHILIKHNKIYDFLDEKLSDAGLSRVAPDALNDLEREFVTKYFSEYIWPNIKLLSIKSTDELPYIDSKSTYIAGIIKTETDNIYGITKIPSSILPFVLLNPIPRNGDKLRYILVEDLVKMFYPKMYAPFRIRQITSFRIVRNSDISLSEEAGEDGDYVDELKEIIKQREISDPDCIFLDSKTNPEMLEFLLNSFNLRNWQVYYINRVSYSYLDKLRDALPEWIQNKICYPKFEPFNQLVLKKGSIINSIKEGDILSVYPYDSMMPFLNLLEEASYNPYVREIRITIYRLSSHPKIIEHLINAAHNGKTVKVLMEIRARFDEDNNINWAAKLKEEGIDVRYGDEKYKVHCKLCQIVFGIDEHTRYITQLSTGNYNEKSAKLYTDFSLITYDNRIGKDVSALFNDIFHQKTGEYKHLLTAPKSLHRSLIKLINREAAKGDKGRIFIKCNSVTDEKIIEALMEASCKGCKISMIVRGICCLLPGVDYCTENIEIVNVVGRFLEHSRVYIFGEGEEELMFISSADLMNRNMHKRVELACPIYDSSIRDRIHRILSLNFRDNVKGRILDSNGEYQKKPKASALIDSQQILMNLAN